MRAWRGEGGRSTRTWLVVGGEAKMRVQSRLQERVKRKVHLPVSWSYVMCWVAFVQGASVERCFPLTVLACSVPAPCSTPPRDGHALLDQQ